MPIIWEYKQFDNDVCKDLEILLSQEELDFEDETTLRLYVQTIGGHASEGHTAFFKNPCLTTHIEIAQALSEIIYDVYKIQEMSPDEFKGEAANFLMLKNEEDIKSLEEFVYQIIEGKKPKRLRDKKRRNLFGHCLYDEIILKNPLNFLKGAWVGSLMDSAETRVEVEKKFGIAIGKGEIFLGNWQALVRYRGKLDNLAVTEHSQEDITLMKEEGLLFEEGEVNDKFQQVYVRYKKGQKDTHYKQSKNYVGVHDGLMVLLAGIVYGTDGALGLNALDIVDTLDKNIKHFIKGGWDEKIGRIIEENQELIAKNHNKNFELDKETLYDLIYLGAIPQDKAGRRHRRRRGKGIELDSPSTRYLNKIEKETTTLRSYIQFLEGEVPKNKYVGPKWCKTTLYSEIVYLLRQITRKKLIKVPKNLSELKPILEKNDL
ncbi:MAG: hypothetical protein ISS48_03510 [Candidatus Aenigmarchaeota archaeon]|nr:hypothetical protein [Candidatus Aenigmarchaeota archaeon]